MATLDQILEYHGNPGKFQLVLWALLLFTLGHVGMVQQFNIMILYKPDHHCKPEVGTNWTLIFNDTKKIYPDECSVFINPEKPQLGTKSCENGYEYNTSYGEIYPINEFDLVCENKHWLESTISISFIGVLIGGLIFGQLADRYGRKITLSIAITLLSILSISVYFAPNLATFITLRLLMGILSQGTQAVGLAYGSELFLSRMRTITQTSLGILWAFILPTLAFLFYALRNWRTVHLTMGLLTAISAIYVWFLPESVSWLVSSYRTDEAVKVLNRFAKFNGIPINTTLKDDLDEIAKEMQIRSQANSKQRARWTHLFKTPIIRRITLSLLYIWFTSACIGYGLSFSINFLKANHRYANFGICGIIEVVLRLSVMYLFVRYGRITIMSPVLVLCGILTIIGFLITQYVPAYETAIHLLAGIIVLIGRNLMAVNFTMIVVLTSELVPVSLRSTGVGFGFAAGRIGNIVVPYTLFLAELWVPLPQILYGIMAIIAGIILATLPETFNKPMPSTIQDIEDLVKSKGKLSNIEKAKELITPTDEEMQLQSLMNSKEKDLNENHQNGATKI